MDENSQPSKTKPEIIGNRPRYRVQNDNEKLKGISKVYVTKISSPKKSDATESTIMGTKIKALTLLGLNRNRGTSFL